jgi:glycosyltransferase involved in cell wall biosynthesis
VNNPGDDLKLIHLGLGWVKDSCGGLERYQHGLCMAHAKMGYSVEAWLQSRIRIDQAGSYTMISYASPKENRWIKISKLRKYACKRLPQNETVFISHHASVSKAVLPRVRGMPHIVHFHGPWADESAIEGAPKWKAWLQRRIERRAYNSANSIITLSAAFKRVIIERYGVDDSRVHVIPGGIDAAAADPGVDRVEARDRLGWPKDRPILLSVRRLVRRVGIDVLIEAIGRLRDRHPDLMTLIGGTGPLKEELEQRIKDTGLINHVRLLGFIPDDQLSFAYAAADYSIVPTQGLEGFGLVTIESLAAGTPVIVTPVGSLPDVIEPFCKQLVLPGFDSKAIAEGLDRILTEKVAVSNSIVCKEYVKKYFDWTVIAPKVMNVYLNSNN